MEHRFTHLFWEFENGALDAGKNISFFSQIMHLLVPLG